MFSTTSFFVIDKYHLFTLFTFNIGQPRDIQYAKEKKTLAWHLQAFPWIIIIYLFNVHVWWTCVVQVNIHMYVWKYMYPFVCMCGLQFTSGIFLGHSLFSPYSLRRSLSPEPRVCWDDRPHTSLLWISPMSAVRACNYRWCYTHWRSEL